MRLNQSENEEDVMPFFKWNSEKSFVFGLVMRVLKNDITQGIPSEFYNRDSFSISDIDGTEGIDTCKSFYYIALNKDFLITNLRGNLPVNRVEAYLNFLVKEQRRVIYSFTPVMTIPEGFPLYKIKKISIGDGISLRTSTGGIGSTIKELSKDVLSHLLGENPDLTELMKNDIIQASLIIKFRKKPAEMTKEEYERLLGQIAHPLSDDREFYIETKQGRKITGEEIRREKQVVVDTTETGRYNEINLMHEMERFITELVRE
ncbi:hypothetical protein T235_02985 [Tannerella sp. oral taxon BU063 isolate Cell 8/11]|uniref:Uncharacterized protein n=1 Tax=Tannerella sp. oral taxon BU063 isolate Cell 8/11 TaxID=1411915 RepID=W2D1P0_9BACT|nr:hypothetical protein T235_02985 [Tannerella sp. oral taxon BU063 isolate Cell 8/11]